MAAALELVAEGHFEGFTLREAARRVGVNHRAVYHHFADKRALLVALAIEGWHSLIAAMRDELDRQSEAAPTRERLLAVARAYIAWAVAYPAQYRVTLGPRLNDDGRFPELETAIGDAMAVATGEVRRGIERGELAGRDLLQATLSLWGALHGIAELVLERRIRVRRELVPLYAEVLVRPTVLGLEMP